MTPHSVNDSPVSTPDSPHSVDDSSVSTPDSPVSVGDFPVSTPDCPGRLITLLSQPLTLLSRHVTLPSRLRASRAVTVIFLTNCAVTPGHIAAAAAVTTTGTSESPCLAWLVVFTLTNGAECGLGVCSNRAGRPQNRSNTQLIRLLVLSLFEHRLASFAFYQVYGAEPLMVD
ncbi:hypothetical protein RRG08_064220 [Elysia crispata]|uniref:Uncharacterized protein n=1 Tax=Elysia crispata TaxID=231223 RepID=A0AAE0YFD6_9GAST|nr:hypothetical protein RRG08_064220 [Elysia crispata]